MSLCSTIVVISSHSFDTFDKRNQCIVHYLHKQFLFNSGLASSFNHSLKTLNQKTPNHLNQPVFHNIINWKKVFCDINLDISRQIVTFLQPNLYKSYSIVCFWHLHFFHLHKTSFTRFSCPPEPSRMHWPSGPLINEIRCQIKSSQKKDQLIVYKSSAK